VDPEANIIFGAGLDDTMQDEVRITVIATGFEPAKATTQPIRRFSQTAAAAPIPRQEVPRVEIPRQEAPRQEPAAEREPSSFGRTDRVARDYSTRSAAQQQPAQRPAPGVVIDEDDLDVPPFLRRRR